MTIHVRVWLLCAINVIIPRIELTDGTNRRRHVPRVGHDDGQVSMNKHIEIVADR